MITSMTEFAAIPALQLAGVSGGTTSPCPAPGPDLGPEDRSLPGDTSGGEPGKRTGSDASGLGDVFRVPGGPVRDNRNHIERGARATPRHRK